VLQSSLKEKSKKIVKHCTFPPSVEVKNGT
jgi:hypothetical protein